MPPLENSNMRLHGDPLADQAADYLWNDPNCDIRGDLKQIIKNHRSPFPNAIKELDTYNYVNEEGEQALQAYFNFGRNFEASLTDFDKQMFAKNAEIFAKNGFFITFLLFFKSLPTGYMSPNPALVLRSSTLLEQFAARRVMETAQFVFAVNDAEWYKFENLGMQYIMRTRMMHAGMRRSLQKNGLLKHRPQIELTENKDKHKKRKSNSTQEQSTPKSDDTRIQWDTNKHGVPINQEDLTLTNYLFSLTIIDGLKQMGIHLTEEEQNALYHTWQKIGEAMGIDKTMLRPDIKEGRSHFEFILNKGISENNPSGPALTEALLRAMNTIIGQEISLGRLEHITMYFLHDKRALKSLGLHHQSWYGHIEDD
ncbi:MAG: oxygenase MpaB family protein, partial [Bacteroidota bacterium]